MKTGKAKQDFRVGPDLFQRGHMATIPDDFADMLESKPIEVVKVEPIKPVVPTIDDVIKAKVQEPKQIFAKKRANRGKKQ